MAVAPMCACSTGASNVIARTAEFVSKMPAQVSLGICEICVAAHYSYVYLADLSQCPSDKDVCDWQAPPRYQEDVLAAAEAFHKTVASADRRVP